MGRQWPQRFFWGWRYTLKHLQSQDGGLVAKSRPTLATPWTLALQALLSTELSRQAHWSGVPFPPPGDLPYPGIEPGSPALQADSLPTDPPGKTRYSNAAAATKLLQSCSTLCDPIDGSPLASAVPGILQARTLEWVAISFSSAWK